MPNPRSGESRNKFVSRCIPIVKAEGVKQAHAVGKCEGIYTNWVNKKREKKKK